MHIPPASMSSESDEVVSLNKNVAADIIRLQGEELVKVRIELENAQNLNEKAFQLFQATDNQIAELQDAILQRNTQITILQQMLTDLQRENNSFSTSINFVRENLHALDLGRNSSSQYGRDDIGSEQSEHPSAGTEEEQKLRYELEASLSEARKLREELNNSKRDNEVLLTTLSQHSNKSADIVHPEESQKPVEQNSDNSDSESSDEEEAESEVPCSLELSDKQDCQSESTPSAEHVTSIRSTPAPTAGSLQSRFTSGFTVSGPLAFSQGLKTKTMRTVLVKAIGLSGAKQVKMNPESLLIANTHNRNQTMLIVLSKGTNTKELSKESKQWKKAFVAVKGQKLYIQGEYEHRNSQPVKLGLSDYELFPETAKDYVLSAAKNLKVKTKQDMIASMKSGGIAIHGIPIQLVRSGKVLEQLVISETKRRGYKVTKSG